jgi:hypothetical protein
MNVHLSAWNNSAPIGRIFMKFVIWIFFENPLGKFKFFENLTKIMGNLHEDQYTFLILCLSIPLRIKTLSDKLCRQNQTHTVCSIKIYFIFFEKCGFNEVMWKNIVYWIDHRWQYGACALHAGYLWLKIHCQVVKCLLLFHRNNGWTEGFQCTIYVHCLSWVEWRCQQIRLRRMSGE